MAGLTKLQKLEFSIGVRDNGATSKLGKLMASVDKATKYVPNMFKKAGLSIAGVWGSLKGMDGILNGGIDFNRAIGEVKSLDVSGKALEHLSKQAKRFSLEYGGAAADVIRASYDIQSAIAGLDGRELGSFAYSSALLAKATKADAATITNYMGTMYGIFKKNADRMGKSAWVEQLTGQTATAVQMFKTTGAEMNAAFSSLGASATAAGINAAEQMAVLGTLQSTMGGSTAGTQYNAFLRGVGKAQGTLGLKFTDDGGNMLGISDILEKIEGKFGKNLTVAQADLLTKAFGSSEASKFVQQLLLDTQGLRASIESLGKVKGLDKATAMAQSMTDVWMQARGSISTVGTTFSQALLPPIEALVGKFNNFLATINRWMTLAPNLTRLIGLIALGVVSFTAAMGALSATIAVGKIAVGGFTLMMNGLGTVTKLVTAAQWLWNAAINANPLSLIITGIVTAVSLAWLLIDNWETLTAVLGDTWWGRAILSVLDAILAPFRLLFDGIIALGKFVGLIDEDFSMDISTPEAVTTPVPAALAATQTASAPEGGIKRELASMQTNNRTSDNSTHIGEQHIHVEKRVSSDELRDAWALGV